MLSNVCSWCSVTSSTEPQRPVSCWQLYGSSSTHNSLVLAPAGISELISRGADVNLETSRGTPLITAATEGDCSSLTLLLVGAQPRRRGAVVPAVFLVEWAQQWDMLRMCVDVHRIMGQM
jgi:hypothetical protein